jgi:tetratricopeptide (TPR) repeat protein
VNALIYVAATQQNLGEVEESIEAGMRALELDPLSPATNLQIGRAQLAARRPAAALRPLQSSLEILPDFILPRVALGEALLMLGRTADAVATFRQAAAIAPTLALGDLVRGLAAAGEDREARSVLAQLLALDDAGRLPPLSLACAYAGLGDADAAFGWLDRGFAARTSLMVTVKMWPGLDPIRGDPRFDDLLRRMRLDDASLAGGRAGA